MTAVECGRCGKVISKPRSNQKYCRPCGAFKSREQDQETKRRGRVNSRPMFITEHAKQRFIQRVNSCENPVQTLCDMWSAGRIPREDEYGLYGVEKEHGKRYKICRLEDALVLVIAVNKRIITMLEPRWKN